MVASAALTSWNTASFRPVNDSIELNDTPVFTLNFTDDTNTTLNCTLYINNTPYGTNVSVQNATDTNFVVNATLTDGAYLWYFNCTNGTAGQMNQSPTFRVDVDAVNPAVFIGFPRSATPASNKTGEVFAIVWNYTEANARNITIELINASGSVVNDTNITTGVANGTFVARTDTLGIPTGTPEGIYSINVTVKTVGNRTNESNSSNSVIVDTTAPFITQVNPINNSNTSVPTVAFEINVSDNLDTLLNCTLRVNATETNVSVSVANQTVTTIATVLTNGTHSWNVTCSDDAGNTRTSGTQNVTVDTIAPSVAFVTPTSPTFTSGNININASANDTAGLRVVQYRLERTDLNGSFTNMTNLAGQFWNATIIAGVDADGNYTIRLNATDVLNNSNTTTIVNNIVLDTRSPGILLIAPPNNSLLSVSTVNLTWNATDNLDIDIACNVSVNGAANSSDRNSLNNTATNLTIQVGTDGAYTWFVSCADNASNTNTSGTFTFTVDDTAPTVVIASPSNKTFTTNATPVITINVTDALDNGSMNFSVYVDNVFNVAGNATNNTLLNVTLAALTNGTHSIIVTATDDANNTGTSANLTLSVDTVAPAVVLIAPSNASLLSASTVNLTWNATDNVNTSVSCNVTVNGAANSTLIASANNTPTNLTIQTGSDGVYSWNVSCADSAGNSGTSGGFVFTIDDTAPSVVIASPSNKTFTTNPTPVITINVTDALDNGSMNFSIYVDNVFNVAGNATNNTLLNVTLAALTNGTHSLIVTATDDANNTGTSANLTITVDNEPPAVVLIFPAESANLTSSTVNLTWNATDRVNTSVSCNVSVNGAANSTLIASANNTPTNLTIQTGSERRYNWSVSCSDSAGNVGNSSVGNFTVDRSAPVVTIASPANNTHTNDPTPEITINVTDGGDNGTMNFSIYVDGAFSVSGNATNGTNVGANLSALTNGTHTLVVSATDDFGQTGNSSVLTITVDTVAPVVSFIAPANGSDEGTATTVFLVWNGTDNLGPVLLCNLTLDGAVLNTSLNLTNGSVINASESVSAGSHSWYVNCSDNASNSFTPGVRTFTTSSSSSSGLTGGGGGGGGGGSVSSSSSLTQWESSVTTGEDVNLQFLSANVPIEMVSFTADASAPEVRVTATSLSGAPVGEPVLNTLVYQYLKMELTPPGIADSYQVQFRVSKKWLADNGMTPGDVALFRLEKNKWVQYNAFMFAEDGTYHFVVNIPGFSYFAIGKRIPAAVEAVPAPTTAPKVVPTPPPAPEFTAPASETAPESAPAPSPDVVAASPSGMSGWLWAALVLFIAGAGAVAFFVHKSQK